MRYFGYRPLAFFEDGNQYGLWIASATLLASWRAKHTTQPEVRAPRLAIALVLLGTAVASQSAGALILLLAGLVPLFFEPALPFLRKALLPALLLFAVALGTHLSGIVPLRAIAKETAMGQMVLETLKSSGRGSLSWRIGQDEQTLPTIQNHLIAGSGQWDWWSELGKRPWGLALLMMGQFGLVGFMLVAAAALRSIWVQFLHAQPDRKVGRHDHPQLVFAILVLMTLMDALLNAFLILPVIMAAAAGTKVASSSENTGSGKGA